MIVLNNLNLTIGNNHILKNLNLHIDTKEKIALIGPSGAGKTSLLNIISKQITSYEGNILLHQKNIRSFNDFKVYANEVGIIRQQFDLVESLNVINNVLVGKLKDWTFLQSLRSLSQPLEKETALKALQAVRMESFINTKTALLSGGEKQRVAIARLLVQNPKIILADEPVASLDPSLAEETLQLLIETTIDKTLLVVLHSIEYSLKYFDRIIAIKDGSIYFDKAKDLVTKEDLNSLYKR